MAVRAHDRDDVPAGERHARSRAPTITNMSPDPMPVAVGFHPYFQLTDSPRDEWTIAVGARTRWTLDANKVPTGETVPIEQLFPNPSSAPLRDYSLDDVFSDLVRDEAGARDDVRLGAQAASRCRHRRGVSLGGRVGAESIRCRARRAGPLTTGGTEFHLLRADGGHHQCGEHGPPRQVSRASNHRAGRNMACTFFHTAIGLRARRKAAPTIN